MTSFVCGNSALSYWVVGVGAWYQVIIALFLLCIAIMRLLSALSPATIFPVLEESKWIDNERNDYFLILHNYVKSNRTNKTEFNGHATSRHAPTEIYLNKFLRSYGWCGLPKTSLVLLFCWNESQRLKHLSNGTEKQVFWRSHSARPFMAAVRVSKLWSQRQQDGNCEWGLQILES